MTKKKETKEQVGEKAVGEDKNYKELCQELEAVRKEKDDLFGKLQRVSADYANYQKRNVKQIADSVSYEKELVIKRLLPVLDNFEHTIINAEKAEDVEVIADGIKIVYDQMVDILNSLDLEQIKSVGELFDPAVHEAMMRRSEPESEDGIILEEFQKGYKLNGRVVRPSRVIVNKIEQQPEDQDAEESSEE
ncbi:MAG: nucleotide exchange factor GrpE [Phycisphaerae bacterium]|nr:nucleotide exchange factor GrpE [Phycisphaerae bacterium]